MKRYKGEAILFLAALLWGSCFVFQKEGMDYIGPYTLGACRFLLGALILIPVMPVYARIHNVGNCPEAIGSFKSKKLLLGGIACGCTLFAAASLQQIGLIYTTAGKAGFITSMEIVLVAAVSLLISRKIQKNILFGVALAVLGMYFLCMAGGHMTLRQGDMFELAAVLFWAVQIMLIDRLAKEVDVIKLSFLQFMTTGILSLIFMLLFEKVSWSGIVAGIVPILYTAIIEVAVAYTLQIIGQMYTTPVAAAVILSMESVFAAIAGALFLHESLTGIQLMGCVLMMSAVILTQVPDKKEMDVPEVGKENS